MVNATIEGLNSLKTAEDIARLRGKKLKNYQVKEVVKMAKLQIKLVRSTIGTTPNQRKTLKRQVKKKRTGSS